MIKRLQTRPLLAVPLLWLVLLIAYIPLIQRIPNGSDHWYAMDVGEFQVVLNNWGTLHMTGYPHFTILANLFTDVVTLFGVRPLVAAALFSLVWGLVLVALIYWLMVYVTARPVVAFGLTLAYSLTESVWIHNVIAEIYTFGLTLLLTLLIIALWRGKVGGWNGSPYARIYWLALIGGISVAHHRAIVMVAPALLFAVWDELTQDWRRVPLVLVKTLSLGLLGFVPYVYLVIRARMGAAWVYGNPDNFVRFWEQFTGSEWAYIIGPADTFAEVLVNLGDVSAVVVANLTLPGVIVGIIGLTWALFMPQHRKTALVMWLSALVAYGFHVAFYYDILYALILPATLSLVFGWLFLIDGLLDMELMPQVGNLRVGWVPLASVFLLWLTFIGWMIRQNVPFITAIVTDPTGLQTIETVRNAPDGSTVMLPWGLRYFAVGYAHDIAGDLTHITLVDHKSDYTDAFANDSLVIPEYIRYLYPPEWWESQLNVPVIAEAVADDLVLLKPERERVDDIPLYIDIIATQEQLICDADRLSLRVAWLAPADNTRDLSVFVHLLDENNALIAQDDQIAPVFGWRPVTGWVPGEIVHDVYTLPHMEQSNSVRYGMYYQSDDGAFVNVFEHELAVDCG